MLLGKERAQLGSGRAYDPGEGASATKASAMRQGGQITCPNSGREHELNSGLGHARDYTGVTLVNAGKFWGGEEG